MHLNTCKIRSAGHTSGSIEITLPPPLQPLTGLGCRVVVRDGLQPEIVLQPDLTEARSHLKTLWQRLGAALDVDDVAGEFDPGAYVFVLLPPRSWQRGLPLAYADVIRAARRGDERAPGDAEALARLVSILAAGAGQKLGLQASFAVGFGEAVAYAVTQVGAVLSSDFERSMTAGLCRQAQLYGPPAGSPLDESFWHECRPALRRIYEQFRAWQSEPGRHARARQQWYRAFQCESAPGWKGPHVTIHAP